MFHCLAAASADLVIGSSKAARRTAAWRRVFRALDHGAAKSACQDTSVKSERIEVQEFADTFVALQIRRHEADYDPHVRFRKSEVQMEIIRAIEAIDRFEALPARVRAQFCAFALFRKRT